MPSTDQIDRLLPVLETVFQAKQADLAKINERIKALKGQLKSLDASTIQDIASPAQRAGADALWRTWVQDRRKLISRELALAARDRENMRFTVSAALAKLEAARKLKTHLMKGAEKTAERRANW